MQNQAKLNKKLMLNRETIRELTAGELRHAAGGLTQAVTCTDTVLGPECESRKCFSLGTKEPCHISYQIDTGCGIYTQRQCPTDKP